MDLYNLILTAKIQKGEGGGGDIDVDALNVTENGTYTASSGHAFSPVSVNVPQGVFPSGTSQITSNGIYDITNFASASVNVPIPSGYIQPTGTSSITSNGIYDITPFANVDVNVSGGGGSLFTKIAEKDIEVSTTTTSATTQGEITLPENYSDRLLWVSVRDKAGKRNGYYYGGDSILTPNSNEGSISNNLIGRIGYSVDSSGKVRPVQSSYGIMPYGSNGVTITISSRYNSSSTLTINGTFHIEVYVLDWPTGSPYNA